MSTRLLPLVARLARSLVAGLFTGFRRMSVLVRGLSV